AQRVRTDPLDADLLDQVVAGRARVQRGDVRRPGQEPRNAVRILQLRLEGERSRVRLPARHRRLEPLDQIGTHVQPAGAGAAAEPLDRAADCEVDGERRYVEPNRPGRI